MITQKDVQHIAELARIELTQEEKDKFEKELSGILDFFEQLNEVDTEGVLPMAGGTASENRMREDSAVDVALEGKSAELLQAIPEKKEGWVKVKAVFK